MTRRRRPAAGRDEAASLFDNDDEESTGDGQSDISTTLSPAQKLLVYCDAAGIAVRPSRAPGRVTVALEPLPPVFRAALDECERELRALVETIPAGGWLCQGGCGRRSLFTDARAAYRCWTCGGGDAS